MHYIDAVVNVERAKWTFVGHRRLDAVPGTGTVQCCSVGKSTYTYDGRKIFGPTPDPIEIFAVKLEGERLIISLK